MYPEANSTICSNLLFDFDLDDEGKPIPGVEDDLTDRDKIDTKTRILNAMRERLEQRFLDLCQASRTGDANTVVMLARQGANLNQSDYDGRTAMHLAVKEGNHKVVEVLLQKDADMNARDRWGQVGYEHCVTLLVRARACFEFDSSYPWNMLTKLALKPFCRRRYN
jgi:ankyrin repeat protein